jgi:hypothetical protein
MNAKKIALIALGTVIAVLALYLTFVLKWSYSSGERAGWVQKISNKGWMCKTWEGELALVSTPGAPVEKFLFTVHSDAVAADINRLMGQRVALHYEEKVGIPTSCFGDTRYFVNKVMPVEGPQQSQGFAVPAANPANPAQGASQPAASASAPAVAASAP